MMFPIADNDHAEQSYFITKRNPCILNNSLSSSLLLVYSQSPVHNQHTPLSCIYRNIVSYFSKQKKLEKKNTSKYIHTSVALSAPKQFYKSKQNILEKKNTSKNIHTSVALSAPKQFCKSTVSIHIYNT